MGAERPHLEARDEVGRLEERQLTDLVDDAVDLGTRRRRLPARGEQPRWHAWELGLPAAGAGLCGDAEEACQGGVWVSD